MTRRCECSPDCPIPYGTCHCGCGEATTKASTGAVTFRRFRKSHERRWQPPASIPYGYCHCGCGQPTNIAKRNHSKRGDIRGEPRRFLHGHFTRIRRGPRTRVTVTEQTRCLEPLTLDGRLRIASRRVTDARQAVDANPSDVVLRLALQARCEERDAIRRVMERSA